MIPSSQPTTTLVNSYPPPTAKPTLLSQNSDANSQNAISTPILAGIIALCILCALAIISAIVCYRRPKIDNSDQLRLREWINANQDTVDVALFESPQYRQSVLEPRASEVESVPRFSIFNPNPLANIHTKTEAEAIVTLDEQYHTPGGVVPETANPHFNRQNSVRIHLPITRDTEVFGFKMF